MLSYTDSDVEHDISQLTSLPTTHEMVKKHQQYLKKLEQVDCLLKENGVTHVDIMQSTSDEEDIEINPGQGSGKLKNISELSCSEDCLWDRCVHVKFAAANQESEPLGHSTSAEQGACRMDFVEEDSFKLKNVGLSYIANVHDKLDHLTSRLEFGADDEFVLKVVDKLENLSTEIDSLL